MEKVCRLCKVPQSSVAELGLIVCSRTFPAYHAAFEVIDEKLLRRESEGFQSLEPAKKDRLRNTSCIEDNKN